MKKHPIIHLIGQAVQISPGLCPKYVQVECALCSYQLFVGPGMYLIIQKGDPAVDHLFTAAENITADGTPSYLLPIAIRQVFQPSAVK